MAALVDCLGAKLSVRRYHTLLAFLVDGVQVHHNVRKKTWMSTPSFLIRSSGVTWSGPSFFRLGLASTSYCFLIEVEEKARGTTPSLALPLLVPKGLKGAFRWETCLPEKEIAAGFVGEEPFKIPWLSVIYLLFFPDNYGLGEGKPSLLTSTDTGR